MIELELLRLLALKGCYPLESNTRICDILYSDMYFVVNVLKIISFLITHHK